jgi:hypothetical protein
MDVAPCGGWNRHGSASAKLGADNVRTHALNSANKALAAQNPNFRS